MSRFSLRLSRDCALSAGGVVALVAGVACGCLTACKASRLPTPERAGIIVDVVGPKGVPLGDAEVEGLVEINPGPVASTCCSKKRFATGTTAENGRTTLADAPVTFRAFHFRASFRNWPSREVEAGSLLGRPGAVRIVLGPAREVRGRVDLGADCPLTGGLEVSGSPPEARAKVAADGSFSFKSLAPWASVSVFACGRGARQDLEVDDNRPTVLVLPQANSP